MMLAARKPQPPIHPTYGPKARDAHVNVVPLSGISSLSSLYPIATRNIGTKPMSSTAGT